MVRAVVQNSAAGAPHPDDPNLMVPFVSILLSSGAWAYTYDSQGRVSTAAYNNGTVTKTSTYAYDTYGRLTGVTVA